MTARSTGSSRSMRPSRRAPRTPGIQFRERALGTFDEALGGQAPVAVRAAAGAAHAARAALPASAGQAAAVTPSGAPEGIAEAARRLVNVLRGEMNLVGPRPERPAIALRLRQDVEGYALRYRVRPGITGWARINHPYDATLEDVRAKVRYDLEHIGRRGGW